MSPQNLLLARLDAFVTGYDEAEKAINSKGINPKLFQRAAPDLVHRISEQRKRIEDQRSRITKNQSSADSWNRLQTYEEEGSMLFGECLAFLQAARARGHDVDADLCEIADALLDELAGGLTNIDWKRFTVLATEEFFLDLAQIIRVRFPCSGIWDLPVSAHEFGHFVAGRLNVTRAGSHSLPFQEYKEGFRKQYANRGGEWMFYLEEYFADVFATFALGPAYLCTCLLLRFDPASAHSENDKRHPSYAKRAHAILQTLRRMSLEKDAQGLKTAADALGELWNQTLTSAGQSLTVPEEDVVAGLVSSFYEMLKSGAPLARFNRWENAKKQCPWVAKGELPAEVQATDLKISDLLNAAWLCRLKPDADPRALSDNVIRLCRLRVA
ncbi:MAG: hypothetical protein QOC70_146 [Verrucomicrobiota bacterium]